MSKYLTILITMICINLTLVLGGIIPINSSTQDGNFIISLFSFASNDPTTGVSINSTFQSKVAGLPAQGGSATTGLGFIDGIKMIADLFYFLISTISAPFQLLFNPNIILPSVFRVLVGLPLTILYIFSLIHFLRGNE